jgi:hypothetical protein
MLPSQIPETGQLGQTLELLMVEYEEKMHFKHYVSISYSPATQLR